MNRICTLFFFLIPKNLTGQPANRRKLCKKPVTGRKDTHTFCERAALHKAKGRNSFCRRGIAVCTVENFGGRFLSEEFFPASESKR